MHQTRCICELCIGGGKTLVTGWVHSMRTVLVWWTLVYGLRLRDFETAVSAGLGIHDWASQMLESEHENLKS
jgi:hypothetical protein